MRGLSVGGNLTISRNRRLTDVQSLNSLYFVGRKISIRINASLGDLNAFGNLTHLGGSIVINNNHRLLKSFGFDPVQCL